jgi:NitT/TauT family transport system permease protein
MKVLVGRLLLTAALLGLWEFASGRLIRVFFISSPSKVFSFIVDLFASGELLPHLLATLEEAAIGYVLGAAFGIGTAIALSRFPFAERVLQPFIMAFYGIPRIALAPLFIIWFGIGLLSKVVIVISVVFFIAFINTLAGLGETNPGFVNTLRAMGASERQLFTKVRLPASLPWIFVGLKVGVPYALVGAIIGELLAASQGLGYLLQRYGGFLDTGRVLAIIIVLAAIVVVLNSVMNAVEARLFQWKPKVGGATSVGL